MRNVACLERRLITEIRSGFWQATREMLRSLHGDSMVAESDETEPVSKNFHLFCGLSSYPSHALSSKQFVAA